MRTILAACAIAVSLACSQIATSQGGAGRLFETKRRESRDTWLEEGRRAVERAKAEKPEGSRARNVILFVGDGMGVSTVTAARILAGQMRGESGEENALSFERFPYLALSKTYSVNQQTSDSAPTMTALITGAKTNDGSISVDQDASPLDPASVAGNELPTLVEIAEEAGLATGVVTTARLTHATPAACYAHTPERNWESDADLSQAARDARLPDIAAQLIDFPYGDGLEVALGGGRDRFLPKSAADPEDEGGTGRRLDGRDLAKEWVARRPGSAFVWNKRQFDEVDPATPRLLGLFERSHMEYEHDRAGDTAGEPSLSEMTAKAIDMLSRNRKGFLLVVEGGRVDHAHHDGNAFRALTDTIELARAVEVAATKTKTSDTLIVVTADHSHVFTMAGYPTRGNDILGKVRENGRDGRPSDRSAVDMTGNPFTTLGYANGPGARKADGKRPDLAGVDTTAHDYRQDAAIPLGSETHGGEDVAVYARGPNAHLVRGVIEQHVIFHIMLDALGLPYRAPRAR